MDNYTEREKLLIDTYKLGYLSRQEKQMVSRETNIEKQAKIVLAYRADLERWVDMEKEYYKDKRRNQFTRTHEGNKVYGDTPDYDDGEFEDTYSANRDRSKRKK